MSLVNYGDNYETHPFDLKYVLSRWAVRSTDVIWDPFVSTGHAQRAIEGFGYQLYKGGEDIMKVDKVPEPVTLIITNPPFSDKSAILEKLASLRVPFVVILPTIVLQRDYFTNVVRSCHRHWHAVLPNKSLAFHYKGEVQHLPAFKSFFLFSCPSTESPQELELNHIENVKIELLSYDDYRKRNGWSTENFDTETQ